MSARRSDGWRALAFLTPNLLGFLCLTLLPLVLSLGMAFTNWDLTLHNQFKPDSSLEFVGLDNFRRLFDEPNFWQYFGNTLFLMMGIPIGIAGSLSLAVLLTRDMRGGSSQVWRKVILFAILLPALAVLSTLILLTMGMEVSAMTFLVLALAGVAIIGGSIGGSMVYRTLFYLPSFTAGAAVYIVWKQLYNPSNGPVNSALKSPLLTLTRMVQAAPNAFEILGLVLLGLLAATAWLVFQRLRKMYVDGDLGGLAAIVPIVFCLIPAFVACWKVGDLVPSRFGGIVPWAIAGGVAALAILELLRAIRKPVEFPCAAREGFGTAAMLSLAGMVGQFVLLGLGLALLALPSTIITGGDKPEMLTPPKWLAAYHWAKPAIMMMGLWIGLGSNNMLLYIAGLTNVPPELYEAADIDGARPMQRFWHVTWPQLAPTTFFIVIMSVIGGLQGGFEQARIMTQGGPAGSTTTLSYYVYNEGFQTGRLGYSSAIAWTLFALIFSVTVFNWKFGNRYVND